MTALKNLLVLGQLSELKRMTDLTLLLLTHRSVLKRGPFGTEDDFIVPPPAKLTRTEEPKRGVLGPGDKWESLDHSELLHLASLASPPCMFVLQTTTSPSVGGGRVQGRRPLGPEARTGVVCVAVPRGAVSGRRDSSLWSLFMNLLV